MQPNFAQLGFISVSLGASKGASDYEGLIMRSLCLAILLIAATCTSTCVRKNTRSWNRAVSGTEYVAPDTHRCTYPLTVHPQIGNSGDELVEVFKLTLELSARCQPSGKMWCRIFLEMFRDGKRVHELGLFSGVDGDGANKSITGTYTAKQVDLSESVWGREFLRLIRPGDQLRLAAVPRWCVDDCLAGTFTNGEAGHYVYIKDYSMEIKWKGPCADDAMRMTCDTVVCPEGWTRKHNSTATKCAGDVCDVSYAGVDRDACCRPNWEYMILAAPALDWATGYRHCRAFGGSLARVVTAGQEAAVLSLQNVYGVDLWIGGRDARQEAVWQWEDSSLPPGCMEEPVACGASSTQTCIGDQCCPAAPESGGLTFPCPLTPEYSSCQTSELPSGSLNCSLPANAEVHPFWPEAIAPSALTRWMDKEPNNDKGAEDCLETRWGCGAPEGWNDNKCTGVEQATLCQREVCPSNYRTCEHCCDVDFDCKCDQQCSLGPGQTRCSFSHTDWPTCREQFQLGDVSESVCGPGRVFDPEGIPNWGAGKSNGEWWWVGSHQPLDASSRCCIPAPSSGGGTSTTPSPSPTPIPSTDSGGGVSAGSDSELPPTFAAISSQISSAEGQLANSSVNTQQKTELRTELVANISDFVRGINLTALGAQNLSTREAAVASTLDALVVATANSSELTTVAGSATAQVVRDVVASAGQLKALFSLNMTTNVLEALSSSLGARGSDKPDEFIRSIPDTMELLSVMQANATKTVVSAGIRTDRVAFSTPAASSSWFQAYDEDLHESSDNRKDSSTPGGKVLDVPIRLQLPNAQASVVGVVQYARSRNPFLPSAATPRDSSAEDIASSDVVSLVLRKTSTAASRRGRRRVLKPLEKAADGKSHGKSDGTAPAVAAASRTPLCPQVVRFLAQSREWNRTDIETTNSSTTYDKGCNVTIPAESTLAVYSDVSQEDGFAAQCAVWSNETQKWSTDECGILTAFNTTAFCECVVDVCPRETMEAEDNEEDLMSVHVGVVHGAFDMVGRAFWNEEGYAEVSATSVLVCGLPILIYAALVADALLFRRKRARAAAARPISDAAKAQQRRNQRRVLERGQSARGEVFFSVFGVRPLPQPSPVSALSSPSSAAAKSGRGLASLCKTFWAELKGSHEVLAPFCVADSPGKSRITRLTLLLSGWCGPVLAGTLLFYGRICFDLFSSQSGSSEWWLWYFLFVLMSLVIDMPPTMIVRWAFQKNELRATYEEWHRLKSKNSKDGATRPSSAVGTRPQRLKPGSSSTDSTNSVGVRCCSLFPCGLPPGFQYVPWILCFFQVTISLFLPFAMITRGFLVPNRIGGEDLNCRCSISQTRDTLAEWTILIISIELSWILLSRPSFILLATVYEMKYGSKKKAKAVKSADGFPTVGGDVELPTVLETDKKEADGDEGGDEEEGYLSQPRKTVHCDNPMLGAHYVGGSYASQRNSTRSNVSMDEVSEEEKEEARNDGEDGLVCGGWERQRSSDPER